MTDIERIAHEIKLLIQERARTIGYAAAIDDVGEAFGLAKRSFGQTNKGYAMPPRDREQSPYPASHEV